MKEFIVIDVGNTDLVIALILNFKIYKVFRYKTKKFKENKNIKNLSNLLFAFLKKKINKRTKIHSIISSVVPEINNKITKSLTAISPPTLYTQ